MRVKIHHEGTSILIWLFVILAVIIVPLWLWVRPMSWAIGVTVVCTIFYLLVVNFFRSPRRLYTGTHENTVVSSADGTVVALEETFEDECLHCRCIQLSVFMSVFNVHANWFPVDGEVTYVKHHNGRFMAAYLPKSSTENERSSVVIRTPAGQKILMRQIAGAMARRIVTYAAVGDEASVEDHMGFIKFGSRIDLYLPLGTEVLVKIGDKTRGGITEVARLHPEKNA
ncbi:MAG: phosphatidylserine decarboxylase family protein [Muribaculaceae bacterium]|nr:phosphatidylserine decarboxylase family protein [Muribaculaceae bacterium]MDE6196437.1 phosphatidylserine decarboxylase family protein [Muribaculaceae bacterium]